MILKRPHPAPQSDLRGLPAQDKLTAEEAAFIATLSANDVGDDLHAACVQAATKGWGVRLY
jgi:hypothetical protein